MASKREMNDAESDEVRRAAAEIASRLESLGVTLDGRERPEELAQIEEAIERFERQSREARGELMHGRRRTGRENNRTRRSGFCASSAPPA